jgi:hypothetical protein
MSQQTATARVASRALQRRQAASAPLRVVPAAVGQPGNGLFAALCMLLLIGGLVALLMLNTAMAEGSFTLNRLQNTSGELADTHDALTQAIDAQRSPSSLAARAAKLGMVPADSAAFLRLSDGKVLGVATPAGKQAGFTVVSAAQSLAPTPGEKVVGPQVTTTTKGNVTTTTVVVSKPDGSVVTTVTSVDAKTKTTTTTTTTKAPPTKPAANPAAPAKAAKPGTAKPATAPTTVTGH